MSDSIHKKSISRRTSGEFTKRSSTQSNSALSVAAPLISTLRREARLPGFGCTSPELCQATRRKETSCS
jgi:hypothetical protein